jgi:ribosomal-protein-alanine N-acetyltransferase
MIPHVACAMMTKRDIEPVLLIEKNVFPHPWSRHFFELILSDLNNHVVILRCGRDVLGYGGYHLLKNRVQFINASQGCRQTIHLINIAVAPHLQRRGFGTFLMNSLLSHARYKNAGYCYLEVRPSNQKAFSFYRKCGFSVIGIIENFYPQEREDALVMGKTL